MGNSVLYLYTKSQKYNPLIGAFYRRQHTIAKQRATLALPAVWLVYAQSQQAVRTRLGKADFTAAWTEGATMTLDQVLTALEPTPDAAPTSVLPPPVSLPMTLSEREFDVLRLRAQGLSYSAIAEQLVSSPRTGNRHLTSIYNPSDQALGRHR